MKRVFTHNRFAGHWPVGSAAVIVAEDKFEAADLLSDALKGVGLSQEVDPDEMEAIDTTESRAYVLCDGDY